MTGPPTTGNWLEPTQFLLVATAGLFKAGNYAEVVTFNDQAQLEGTALFRIEGAYQPSAIGMVPEVGFRGASSVPRTVEFGFAVAKDTA